MQQENLLIIGTSHIARQSIKEVSDAFRTFEPDILAVELDKARLASLLSEEKPKIRWKSIRTVGIKGFFFPYQLAGIETEPFVYQRGKTLCQLVDINLFFYRKVEDFYHFIRVFFHIQINLIKVAGNVMGKTYSQVLDP